MVLLAKLVIGIAAQLIVNWGATPSDGFTVELGDFKSEIESCVDRGREARIRFELQLCHRRTSWFDGCERERVEVRTMQVDPIADGYKVIADRWGDNAVPISVSFANRAEAMSSLMRVDSMDIKFLARENSERLEHPRRYVSVRAQFDCKGGVSKTLARLSNVLTLGIVDIGPADTGWRDFDLAQR